MKRVTRSFTVEYRQTKRPNAGSTKPDWAHAKPAPAGVDQKANRIATSAFKTVAAYLPAVVSSPSIATGRILPSLVQVALVTEQVEAEGVQLRSQGDASQAGYAKQAPVDGTVSSKLGEQIRSAEDLKSVEAAKRTCLKRPAPLDRALQTLERQGRQSGPGILQKSGRSSITLRVRPPTCLKPHR